MGLLGVPPFRLKVLALVVVWIRIVGGSLEEAESVTRPDGSVALPPVACSGIWIQLMRTSTRSWSRSFRGE